MLKEDTRMWNFVLDMTTIYSFDTCDINISSRFKPVILIGSIENFASHAFVNIVNVAGMAVVYLGWLNNKTHVEERYQKATFALSVYINTRHGRVGQFVQKNPIFSNEQLNKYDDGIYMTKNNLYNWADWTKDYKCQECTLRKGHPHVHVEVKLNNY
jgi:hypothetical protein